MKYCKRFTEGLGYFACFLIFIFIAYTYAVYGGPYLDEESGEMMTVWNNSRGFREYAIMFCMFLAAAVICSLTDKLPFIGIAVTAVPVYFVFKIYIEKRLVFCPMIIAALALMFFAGEIVATVQWATDRYGAKPRIY